MRSAENKMLLYLSEPGIRHSLDGPISDCKSVGVLPRDIVQDSQKFKLIQLYSNWRLAEGSVARGKDKNHQKMGMKYLQQLCESKKRRLF